MIIIYKTETGIKKISPSPNINIKDCIISIPKGCEYKIVDETEKDYQDLSDISPNFDSALTWDLTHDIEKLKELKKEDLRSKREPLLKELDVKYMISLEMNLDSKDIVTEKQRLRDITKLVDDCKTIDEIKKIEV